MAECIHSEVIGGTSQKNRGLKDGSHLWVIRKTVMPAVLIEFGFMDDSQLRESRLMIDQKF
ncbi:N-acetylmuramoyl-L-alanine amidase [Thermoflavimicrobium daqui]|uniref:N-acetylmuramoyl-L-alanine amidase n=1 Tax=Thermoflavimicrobium daqui TaxID=2137476 RepID=UPI003B836D24